VLRFHKTGDRNLEKVKVPNQQNRNQFRIKLILLIKYILEKDKLLGNSKKLNGILRIFLVWIRLILANIKIIA
jgi:hypothetical protein